jgi:hypothetical protein
LAWSTSSTAQGNPEFGTESNSTGGSRGSTAGLNDSDPRFCCTGCFGCFEATTAPAANSISPSGKSQGLRPNKRGVALLRLDFNTRF